VLAKGLIAALLAEFVDGKFVMDGVSGVNLNAVLKGICQVRRGWETDLNGGEKKYFNRYKKRGALPGIR
jgi:hypothetical protein